MHDIYEYKCYRKCNIEVYKMCEAFTRNYKGLIPLGCKSLMNAGWNLNLDPFSCSNC